MPRDDKAVPDEQDGAPAVEDVGRIVKPPIVGPNLKVLVIAIGLLIAVLGASLLLVPMRSAPAPEKRPAPDLPESTFLDRPAAPERTEPEPKPARPWWQGPTGLEEEPSFEEASAYEPAYPAWQPAAEPTPEPADPRREAFERALKSAQLRRVDDGGARAAPVAGALRARASPGEDLGGWAQAVGEVPPALPSPASLVQLAAGTRDAEALPAAAEVAFAHGSPASSQRLPALRRRTLRAGTLIPTRLETALDSDAPGPVRARVLRDVTDSATGRQVLIPAGSELLGSAQSQLAYGDGRVLVAFERLVLPGGVYELPGLEALQTDGARGLTDRVDRHFLPTLGRAALLAAVGAGFQLSQPDRSQGDALSSREVVAAQVGLELSRVASRLIANGLDRRPTVRVRAGERFCVYVSRDLTL